MKNYIKTTRAVFATFGALHPTRFPELSYQLQGNANWRIIDNSTERPVGPQYRTKMELLADLERYAQSFGCA